MYLNRGGNMSSFRRTLIAERNMLSNGFWREDQEVFIVTILEVAHALSRGRKPSSASWLPGINLATWLRHAFHSCQQRYRDDDGIPQTLAEAVRTDLYEFMTSEDLAGMKIMRAITLVERKLVLPRKKPNDLRGDPQYQRGKRNTNLKRKRRYLAQRQGSWYAEDDRYVNTLRWA